MSETPEEQRPASEPAPPSPSQPADASSRPPAVYQRRGFQLVAVGVIGLLLGGFIGLGIGLAAGFAFGGRHDRDDIRHHHQWGPGDGYRQPDGRRMPDRPFGPHRPNPVGPSPAASAPVPQPS